MAETSVWRRKYVDLLQKGYAPSYAARLANVGLSHLYSVFDAEPAFKRECEQAELEGRR